MSAIFDQIFDLMFGDVTHILLVIVALLVVFALTERWRIEWNAKRKRERQNRSRPEDV